MTIPTRRAPSSTPKKSWRLASPDPTRLQFRIYGSPLEQTMLYLVRSSHVKFGRSGVRNLRSLTVSDASATVYLTAAFAFEFVNQCRQCALVEWSAIDVSMTKHTRGALL